MMDYVNPGGVVQNGESCDFFNDPCEYLFRFCLSDNALDSRTCQYGYLQTQYFIGVQNLHFSYGQQVSSSGVTNPFGGPFRTRWQVSSMFVSLYYDVFFSYKSSHINNLNI